MATNRVHALLEERAIPFEVHTHERAVEAQRLAAAEGVSGWDVAKPVLLAISGQLAMAVVPASVHVDLAKASEVLGHSEVRLATEDEFVATFHDCEPGAEPPFGSLYGVPVFLDEKLRARERIVCRDGSHTESITLTVLDYLKVVDAEIVDISTTPV